MKKSISMVIFLSLSINLICAKLLFAQESTVKKLEDYEKCSAELTSASMFDFYLIANLEKQIKSQCGTAPESFQKYHSELAITKCKKNNFCKKIESIALDEDGNLIDMYLNDAEDYCESRNLRLPRISDTIEMDQVMKNKLSSIKVIIPAYLEWSEKEQKNIQIEKNIITGLEAEFSTNQALPAPGQLYFFSVNPQNKSGLRYTLHEKLPVFCVK